MYRFLDSPLGCLSGRAKLCLGWFGALLFAALWAVS